MSWWTWWNADAENCAAKLGRKADEEPAGNQQHYRYQGAGGSGSRERRPARYYPALSNNARNKPTCCSSGHSGAQCCRRAVHPLVALRAVPLASTTSIRCRDDVFVIYQSAFHRSARRRRRCCLQPHRRQHDADDAGQRRSRSSMRHKLRRRARECSRSPIFPGRAPLFFKRSRQGHRTTTDDDDPLLRRDRPPAACQPSRDKPPCCRLPPTGISGMQLLPCSHRAFTFAPAARFPPLRLLGIVQVEAKVVRPLSRVDVNHLSRLEPAQQRVTIRTVSSSTAVPPLRRSGRGAGGTATEQRAAGCWEAPGALGAFRRARAESPTAPPQARQSRGSRCAPR